MKVLLAPWLLLLLLSILVQGCSRLSQQNSSVKVGLVAPFSGEDYSLGYEALFAAKLAIKERNSAGGVGGHGIVLVAHDDQNNPEWGELAAKKMIADPDVKGVIGHVSSESALSAEGFYHLAGMAFISTGATANEVTEQGFPEVFRVVANDTVLARGMADFAAKQSANSRVAILAEPITSAIKLADRIYEALPDKSSLVFGQPFRYEQTDFRDVAARVRTANPDLIVYSGSPVYGGPFWTESKTIGIKAKLMAGPPAANLNFLKMTKTDANGVFLVSLGPYPSNIPEASGMVEGYKALSGNEPLSLAGLTYDATRLLLDAMQRAFDADGKVERNSVNAAIQSTNYEGVTGSIAFDEKGNRLDPQIYIYQFEGKDFPGKRVH